MGSDFTVDCLWKPQHVEKKQHFSSCCGSVHLSRTIFSVSGGARRWPQESGDIRLETRRMTAPEGANTCTEQFSRNTAVLFTMVTS